MLGEVLIKAYQNWYKGAGFKLKNNIKKANKEFQIFREIFKEFDQINSSILEGLIDNKQLFLKEFSRIKNILKIHQDYKAILDNIFHNFNYFMQNFDLIKEWLLSDDFKERYKKENHPYPSLLDPKKLNDKNEKINYHNIPAELAWEMNLPLPDNFKFLFWGSHGVGNMGFHRFLDKSGLVSLFCLDDNNSKLNYCHFFKNLLNSYQNFYLSIINLCEDENASKYYSLIPPCRSICLVRDPISSLRSHVGGKRHGVNYLNIVDFGTNIECVMSNRIGYANIGFNSHFPCVDISEAFIDNKFMCFHDSLLWKFLKQDKIYFLDTNAILGNKCFESIKLISEYFNFNPPKYSDMKFYEGKISEYVCLLPINIELNNFFQIQQSVVITITNIYFVNSGQDIILENIFNIVNPFILTINRESYDLFMRYMGNMHYFKNIKFYLNKIIEAIVKQKNIEDCKKFSEKDLLGYFRNNDVLRRKFKQRLDDDHLPCIKQHRPDIVASWTYYQEFEKMCKELDGDIYEKDL